MDLSRAKNVTIIILIVFNLVLLFNNLAYLPNQGVSKEILSNAVTVLKSRGITLTCKLPKEVGTTYKLKCGNGTLDRSNLAKKLLGDSYTASKNEMEFVKGNKKLVFTSKTKFVFEDSSPSMAVNIKDSDKIKKVARDYLNNTGLLSGNYEVDDLERNQDGSANVYFVEEYKSYPVYDNYSIVRVGNKGVTRMEYSKLQIIGFSANRIEDPAPAYQALLMNYKSGDHNVIRHIDMGYKYPENQSVEKMQLTELRPVWRIKMKGKAVPDYLSTVGTGGVQAD